jgi:hypothetical protein
VRRGRLVLATIAVCSACELARVSEPTAEQRVVGIIESSSVRDGVLRAPDTVTAGVRFDATITTVGLSGCWREAGADIGYDVRLVLVIPYDLVVTRIDGEPRLCTGALVQLPRTVRLVFGQTGNATLRVSGRKLTGGVLGSGMPVSIEKQVVVRGY